MRYVIGPNIVKCEPSNNFRFTSEAGFLTNDGKLSKGVLSGGFTRFLFNKVKRNMCESEQNYVRVKFNLKAKFVALKDLPRFKFFEARL